MSCVVCIVVAVCTFRLRAFVVQFKSHYHRLISTFLSFWIIWLLYWGGRIIGLHVYCLVYDTTIVITMWPACMLISSQCVCHINLHIELRLCWLCFRIHTWINLDDTLYSYRDGTTGWRRAVLKACHPCGSLRSAYSSRSVMHEQSIGYSFLHAIGSQGFT